MFRCSGLVFIFAKTSFSSFLIVFMDRFRARDRELGVYGIDYLYCKVIKIDFVVIYIYIFKNIFKEGNG